MNINRVRLGLMYIFSETDKISSNSKAQLFRFIETANEHQLKVLMMDGELVSAKQLDENACDIIDDRFTSSGIDPYKASTEAMKKIVKYSKK